MGDKLSIEKGNNCYIINFPPGKRLVYSHFVREKLLYNHCTEGNWLMGKTILSDKIYSDRNSTCISLRGCYYRTIYIIYDI